MRTSEARHTAAILDTIGSEHLGTALDATLYPVAAFDMSCLYLFQFNAAPLLVHNGYNDSVPAATLSAYARGGYLLDPFYVACMNGHCGGLWRMRELAPDSFFSSGFAISADAHPCVSSDHGVRIEEVGFIVPIESRIALVYSLMRNLGGGGFSAQDMKQLDLWTPVIQSALRLHYRLSLTRHRLSIERDGGPLEDAFLDILPGQLTETQRLVARAILQGHSNGAIARLLAISEGTVRLHKHNLYQRLSISSHAELFRLFIDYLAHTG